MTASNHTYRRLFGLSSQPSSGTGMPQSMSRVMARGRRSSMRFSEKFRTLGRQSVARPQPRLERARERRQVEEEVVRLDELRRLAVDPAVRVDQVDRVQLVAAVVALVAARAVVAADRAGALDVPVGQRAARARRDGPHGRLLDHVAVLVHRAEHLLHDRVVVARRGAREQVVGQPEVGQVLDDDAVVPVRQLLRARRPPARPAPGSASRARRSRRPSAPRCPPSACSG